MKDQRETPGVAEAASLLDDETQQMTPVPALLDEQPGKARFEQTRAAEEDLDGHTY